MDRLIGAAELLDGPLDDDAALEANLRDLARINRLTGGTALTRRGLHALGEATGAGIRTILDVGTGGADLPVSLLADARREGRDLAITASDSRPEVLAAARRARPIVSTASGLRLEIADGRALPYPDATFDVAHASLVLHHLEPDAVVTFLRELRRVARVGIVVNDLVRGRLAWLGSLVLVRVIARSPYTRHDGPLSVRRAYTRPELEALLTRARLDPVRTVVGFAGHRVAIAAR